jgi:hypothetical protein
MLNFETELSGGHPNSLGNTVAVVDIVLADKSKLKMLYQTYFSEDEVVRLRVSNAIKRICKKHPDLLVEYIPGLLSEISKINQPSIRWTLATLFLWLQDKMTDDQRKKAIDIMKVNLENDNDWIVQNTTLESLAGFVKYDSNLKTWLLPKLKAATNDSRKSIVGRAKKLLKSFG